METENAWGIRIGGLCFTPEGRLCRVTEENGDLFFCEPINGDRGAAYDFDRLLPVTSDGQLDPRAVEMKEAQFNRLIDAIRADQARFHALLARCEEQLEMVDESILRLGED